MKFLKVMALAFLVAACSDNTTVQAPNPQAIGDESIGHYCTMHLSEHDGPKAQIYHKSQPEKAVWFSTVSQIFDYIHNPEEPRDILAIYVNDMGKVVDWNVPNADEDWIDAKTAFYVIDSNLISGMGEVDTLPFGDKAKAEEFIRTYGGKIASFEEVSASFSQ